LAARATEALLSHIKFSGHSDFHHDLKERVGAYFRDNDIDERGLWAMGRKSMLIFAWFFASYGVLVFAPVPVWASILAAVSLGLAGACIGTSVMHDAGHGSYARNKTLNRLMFFSLDMLGGSSYYWKFKHNIMHHTYTNLDGHDDDLDMGVLGRLSPEQRHLPHHRFQKLYIWPLYCLISVKWVLFDDFVMWARRKIGERDVPRPSGKEAVAFWGGKLLFLTLGLVIPALIHPIGLVVAFFFLVLCVEGLALAVTFQLAHCVEEAEFPTVPESNSMESDWATHQVVTTVNFAPNNPLVTWYVGGLNFQIEHHLFPRVSHLHYPALSKIVRQTCSEYDIPYRVQPTFLGGIRSHYRFLRRLGQQPTTDFAKAG
jgi:linoleoyl-CoA desaturase